MPEATPGLPGSEQPLGHAYDLAMLDLDGVVYVGPDAVPGAPDHIAAAREDGMRIAFVTNNASRPPSDVAEHLDALGVPAQPEDVVTSAQAAARVLVERLGRDARVVLLGAVGLHDALVAEGLVAMSVEEMTRDDARRPAAVVTGYGPDVVWRDLMRAAVAIRDGLWWVATNTDMSLPTPYGVAPGHGVQVRMLQQFTGVDPTVAGKPARPLLDETIRRVGGERPLMVGDRLDTDIAGGTEAGVDTLLVLTGVTGLAELVAAPPGQRPTHLAVDLAGLRDAHPAVTATDDGTVEVGGWTARTDGGALVLAGKGSDDDWWRATAVAAWWHLDHRGSAPRLDGLEPPTG